MFGQTEPDLNPLARGLWQYGGAPGRTMGMPYRQAGVGPGLPGIGSAGVGAMAPGIGAPAGIGFNPPQTEPDFASPQYVGFGSPPEQTPISQQSMGTLPPGVSAGAPSLPGVGIAEGRPGPNMGAPLAGGIVPRPGAGMAARPFGFNSTGY